MFNIVMLAIGFLELGFLMACGVTFIVGCYLRNKIVIIASLVVPSLVFGALTAMSYVEEMKAPFPPQLEAPNTAEIPGTYVLDSGSFADLESRGFQDLSASIVLYPNKTFKVTQMPHVWTDGSPESKGYDQCSGIWSVGQDPNNEHCYYLVLQADKNVFPMGAVFLYLSAPKGDRRDYALSVPIFYGDFDYIYFVKQM